MDTKYLKIAAAGLGLLIAAQVEATGLLEIYQQARNTNPQLAAADANLKAVEQLHSQGIAGLLPVIDLTANLNRQDFNNLGTGTPTRHSTNKTASLNLLQPLFRRDLWIQLKQADSQIAQAQAEYAAADQDLIVAIAERYFNILGAQDNLTFATAEKEAIARELDQARQRFEVGLIAITDVHEAQARYDLAVSQEIQAISQLAGSKDALRETAGIHYDTLALLKDEIPLETPEPATPDLWVEQALQQNLSVLAAQAAAETARQEMRRQRAGHLPTLDLNASYNYQDNNFGGIAPIKREDTLVGLRLNVPLYQGGGVVSRSREARHRFTQTSEQLNQATRNAELETRNAFRGIQTDLAQIRALAQSLVSTQTAVDAAEAGFEVGTRTVVDVLNAQREFFRAKFNYAQARYLYLVDQLKLKRAAGNLGQADIERISGYLQAGE